MLKNTYITMMYGMGIPLLFPIAAMTTIITWVGERIMCAYIVKLPPAMGDYMTNSTISTLKFSPILLLINGFWMLSNPQIFDNKWSYIHMDMEPMKSLHRIELNINHSIPLLVLGIGAIFIFVVSNLFPDQLKALGYTMQK